MIYIVIKLWFYVIFHSNANYKRVHLIIHDSSYSCWLYFHYQPVFTILTPSSPPIFVVQSHYINPLILLITSDSWVFKLTFPHVFHLFSRIPTVFPWFLHSFLCFPMVFPWYFPMVSHHFPCFFHIFPWFSHGFLGEGPPSPSPLSTHKLLGTGGGASSTRIRSRGSTKAHWSNDLKMGMIQMIIEKPWFSREFPHLLGIFHGILREDS